MSQRVPTWLPALFVGSLAVGTDDFVIAGLLPLISTDLDVTEAAAGQLVTVFSPTIAHLARLRRGFYKGHPGGTVAGVRQSKAARGSGGTVTFRERGDAR